MRRGKVGVVGLVLLASGCAGAPMRIETLPAPVPGARAVVLVIDGAGGFTTVYDALDRTIKEQCLPLQLESVGWQHGGGRFIADQTEPEYARNAGRRLAERVRMMQQQNPGVPVSLVAHSAGSAVALACAESLPPDSLDRIVLLAPAVSCHYDLRCALSSARRGIDVFTSERDWFYLGLGIRLLGTTDGRCDQAAGKVGFVVPPATAADAALYARLRQHPWDPSLTWTGHDGGHTGTYRQVFLRTRIVPLLWPDGR
jgi:pimeloyl-ACP methyl ester carboxylesterase